MRKKALFLLTCSCILALSGVLPLSPMAQLSAGKKTGQTELIRLVRTGYF